MAGVDKPAHGGGLVELVLPSATNQNNKKKSQITSDFNLKGSITSPKKHIHMTTLT